MSVGNLYHAPPAPARFGAAAAVFFSVAFFATAAPLAFGAALACREARRRRRGRGAVGVRCGRDSCARSSARQTAATSQQQKRCIVRNISTRRSAQMRARAREQRGEVTRGHVSRTRISARKRSAHDNRRRSLCASDQVRCGRRPFSRYVARARARRALSQNGATLNGPVCIAHLHALLRLLHA